VNGQPDPDKTHSQGSNGWDDWWREYETLVAAEEQRRWDRLQPLRDRFPAQAHLLFTSVKPSFDPTPAAVARLQEASRNDLDWLRKALTDERRKWFVADVAKRAELLPDEICEPMLDAAVDELDGSFSRGFVDPCTRVFGPRRVNEYLLSVLESGGDDQKTGAVSALYWAQVLVSYRAASPAGSPVKLKPEDADPESLAAHQALSDVWQRKRQLFLETFVWNQNLDLRRSLIGSLNLDAGMYPDSHKPLVARAIDIARKHPDDYIRRRLQFQLGEKHLIPPLPRRER
jgi:hypothetical protein